MRWDEKVKPEVGDARRRTKFLLFPLTVDGESRWLEVCTFLEVYRENIRDGHEETQIIRYWEPTAWCD